MYAGSEDSMGWLELSILQMPLVPLEHWSQSLPQLLSLLSFPSPLQQPSSGFSLIL